MSNPHNPPAFPDPFADREGLGHPPMYKGSEGMTLRDYFAAKAMQGMMVNYEADKWEDFEYEMSQKAYQIADFMLAARAK